MKRIIAVIVITLVIIGLAIWELLYIDSTIDVMNAKCGEIYTEISTQTTVTDKLSQQVDNIEKYWLKREKTLCLVISHKDMSNIGDYIGYLKASVRNDNLADCQTYALLLRENMRYLGHMISFNFENIL